MYFEADSDLANSLRPTWDSDTYLLLDVMAADELFHDASETIVNVERRHFDVYLGGVYVAFRDEGSCTTLLSIKVFHFECSPVVVHLASFPQSSPGGAEVVLVEGQCVMNAVSSGYASLAPAYLCKADGSWYYYSGSCVCLPGYQPNKDMTQCDGKFGYCLLFHEALHK